jgi:ribosomal protein S27AE
MSSKNIIICPKCGIRYFLLEEDYPMRDKDKLSCEKCGYILKEWNAAVLYSLEKITDKEKNET